jgi:hypothetical protein
MYAIGFEGVGGASQSAINAICPQMNAVVKQAADRAGGELRTRWFGSHNANNPSLFKKLLAMDRYLNQRCVRLTFVAKAVGQKVDCATVEDDDFAQMMRLPTDPVTGERFVPSGARVYLLPSFADQSASEKFNTVCHELSHRVLATTDFPGGEEIYGRDDALGLAGRPGDDLAVTCAENWGYFYMELMEQLG